MKLFALTIFTEAFLLFQVQPLIAKFILPWFGGGPAVWTTCMLFFQVFLLGGYAYAHASTRYLPVRKQAVLHGMLLLAAPAFLPIVPGAHWKPQSGDEPTWRILLLLMACLGLPYLVLSSTGPLLQAWFSRSHPGMSPYRLYALSNVGSLLALVTYPFVFEPALTRQAQASVWAWSFGAFVLLCGGCVWRVWRQNAESRNQKAETGLVEDAPRSTLHATLDRLLWLLLPLCGSVLLLATTNKLCQDVASVPFLWVLPLSLYLLTFILCFDRSAWYRRTPFTLLLFPLLGLVCYALFEESAMALWGLILIYCGNLFVCCMVCHGEACRLKPAPRNLTSFYLLIGAGGALGGVMVGAVAPQVFCSFAELNWGMWLLAALVLLIHTREKTRWTMGSRRWPLWPALLAGVVALAAALLLQSQRAAHNTVFMSRNFYGVLRVFDLMPDDPVYHAYNLTHGYIKHGIQFVEPVKARMPTTYYSEPTGVGLAMSYYGARTNRQVGVVGLGAGTLAAYGRPGDRFRFYEIDPAVQALARTRFTYLRESEAHVEVVMGDARLSLEGEPPQNFDLLVLDAFNSDAIPVHLLTQEAFAIYLRHLKPDGAIAVNISNMHLDLKPVMRGVADRFHLGIADLEWGEAQSLWWYAPSRWVLLSRNEELLTSAPIVRAASGGQPDSTNVFLWTDDYANLFSLVTPIFGEK
jgi:hypothetical protein